jgi:protein phosphatase
VGVIPSPDTSEMAAATGVTVRVFARTDVGRTREHNEDAFLVADLREEEALPFDEDDESAEPYEVRTGNPGMLFIVADGLGGAAAGEVASRMAVQTVFDTLRSRVGGSASDPARFATALRDATLAANEAIHQHALRHRELHGMGTTITAAALLGDTLFVAQVGDSRAYIIRDGAAQQITKDQSLMQKLVEAGEITPEQAELSARRNIILQALGPETNVKIDLTHQLLRRGDMLVLCSDGLFGQVRGDEIAQVAATATDLDALCREVINRANERGGPDNITVVAARFDGSGLTPPAIGDAVGHQAFPLVGQTDERRTPTEPVIQVPPPLPPLPADSPDAEPPDASAAVSVAPAANGPAPTPAPRATHANPLLHRRRERARVYYVVLGAAAILVALLSLWQLLKR